MKGNDVRSMLFFLLVSSGAIALCEKTIETGGHTFFGVGPRTIEALVTAYCPCALCCGEFADGKTSIGDDAFTIDGIAADPRTLPYRTRISIPGIGVREVDDTGGALQRAWRERGEYHIDLRFATHEEALQWGRKKFVLRFLSEQPTKLTAFQQTHYKIWVLFFTINLLGCQIYCIIYYFITETCFFVKSIM